MAVPAAVWVDESVVVGDGVGDEVGDAVGDKVHSVLLIHDAADSSDTSSFVALLPLAAHAL